MSSAAKLHRRVVTGHKDGKSVILSDEKRQAYVFETVKGFQQTYVWSAKGIAEGDPAVVDQETPKSALPAPGGSLVQIVTFPPPAERAKTTAEPADIGREYATRLPGLAETFERNGSEMHITPTLDYAIILDGVLTLEVDDGKRLALSAGDIVVQQGTRHCWRNVGDVPATIAFVMLGG